MNIPAQITAGDTVKWRDVATKDNLGNTIDSAGYTLTYWLRTNTAGEGVSAVATAYGTGWETTLSAATTAGFDAGHWFWQAIATQGSTKVTLGSGQLDVVASLSYAGAPGAFDGRTQAHQDLDAVDAAIRAIVSGGVVQEYSIGGRRLKKYDLAELQVLRSRLIAEVKREQAAASVAQGLGNPHNLFVRF